MIDLKTVLEHLDRNLDASVERLFDLLRFKSVSADPLCRQDCREAARWLAGELGGMGFSAQVRETTGNPMVVGHHEGPSPDSLHVLFYGHYDVQPVDPVEQWRRDPFTPAIRQQADGRSVITGRGASDDKGQLMTFLEACRAFREVSGGLPCRVSVLLEGEEESGSPSLRPFLEAYGDELRADVVLVCDTGMWDPDTPAITTRLRGIVGEEVVIHGPGRDLHSGLYGGAAANPLHVLTRILAALHDASGKVTLEGFYTGVREVREEVLLSWKALEQDALELLTDVGLSRPAGEADRSVLEQIWARPTAEINGVTGGYGGDGFKTVIPASASAKVSFRLVGGQDPEAVRRSFRSHVERNLPLDCHAEFHAHGGSAAVEVAGDSPLLVLARDALGREWPRPAVLIGMGGSIPVVADFRQMLGMESILIGFGLADDQVHSPNEKYDLRCYHKGQRSWAAVLHAFGGASA